MPGPSTVTLGNCANTFIIQVNVGTVGAVTLSQTGSTTVPVPGLLTTDQVSAVNKPTYQAGLTCTGGACLTNGTLTIYYANPSVGNITPTASELYTIEINRPMNPSSLPASIQ